MWIVLLLHWVCSYDEIFVRFCPLYILLHIKQRMKKLNNRFLSMKARCVRWQCTMLEIFMTLLPICGNRMETSQFTTHKLFLSFFLLRRHPVDTGQRSQLMNWGVEFCSFLFFYCIIDFILIIVIIIFVSNSRFFLFLVVDEIIYLSPFLVKHFNMLIWHPTDEVMLDGLFNTKVEM